MIRKEPIATIRGAYRDGDRVLKVSPSWPKDTIQAVIQVPMLAPMMGPTAWLKFMRPALIKPMIMTVVAPLLWITAVIRAPTRTPTKRLFVRIPRSLRICSPAHFCTPPDMLCTPNRNIPRPPANINRFSKSLIVILVLSIPDRRLPDQGSEIPP